MIINLRLDTAWVYYRTNKNTIIHSLLNLLFSPQSLNEAFLPNKRTIEKKNKVPPGERRV